MAERAAIRSLEGDPRLVLAAVYEREVGASLTRVWENVYDWEHLPWLHAQAFGGIEKIAAGEWGWHVRVGMGPSAAAWAEIELVTDRDRGRYVARTLSGEGAPTEIWTDLEALGEDRVGIRVEFHVLPSSEARLARVGEAYRSVYQTLWDQDEEMMQIRERALAARVDSPQSGLAGGGARVDSGLALGREEELRRRLPLVVELAGRPFRIVDLDGELLAHAIECPHLLGPLDGCELAPTGEIRCPWHGYRFDVRSGRSADGRGLRLARAPRVSVDPETGRVTLESQENSG